MTRDPAVRRGGARLTGLILVLGLTAVGILIGGDLLRRRGEDRGRVLMRAIAQVEVDIAVSHLWLEEHVSGDRVDLDELDERLARAGRLAAELAEDALRLPVLAQRTQALADWISAFRAISEERLAGYAAQEPVGIGSPIDERYDAVFAEVFDQSQALGAAIDADLGRERRRALVWFWVWVAIWGGAVVATAGLVGRFERRRHRTERALDASQSQLVASQKIEAVGRLAGGLAHDLNNYLAAIRGHCELVMRRPEPSDRVVAKMERVLALTGKASSLIDRLQGFTQRRPPEREILSLRQLIEMLASMVRPSLGEHVRLETDLAPDLHAISADPAQLEQVLVNLVFNARDALPEGGVIRVRAANRGPSTVRIAVDDEGVGIPPELRERIFEPLVSTKEGAHTGLGLSIVHQIVTAHDGSIGVESTVGRGTTFSIDLPSTGSPPEPGGNRDDPEAPSVLLAVDNEHILLVDDNDDFREATAAVLEDLGYRVTTAANGTEAWTWFERSGADLDLLLTDVVMPGLGGHALADRIRRARDVKVLFLSGHSEEMLGREGVGAGEAQVMKGVATREVLARRIRDLLDR